MLLRNSPLTTEVNYDAFLTGLFDNLIYVTLLYVCWIFTDQVTYNDKYFLGVYQHFTTMYVHPKYRKHPSYEQKLCTCLHMNLNSLYFSLSYATFSLVLIGQWMRIWIFPNYTCFKNTYQFWKYICTYVCTSLKCKLISC